MSIIDAASSILSGGGAKGAGDGGGSMDELKKLGAQLTESMRQMMEFQITQQLEQNPLRAAESNAKAARTG